MDVFPDLTALSDAELSALLLRLEEEEDDVSRRRRFLHGRIDLLRAEHTARLRKRVAAGEIVVPDDEALVEAVVQMGRMPGEGQPIGDEEIDAMPDTDDLSDDELHAVIHELELVEDETSLHRRMLHGKIDILRAERGLRAKRRSEDEGSGHVEVDRLRDILSANLLWKRPEGG